jgi:hypothetical protein
MKGLPQSDGTKPPTGRFVQLGNVAVQTDNNLVNTATSTNNSTAPTGSVQASPPKKIVNQVKAQVQSSTPTQGKTTDQTKIKTTALQGTTYAKDMTSQAKQSKNEMDVARNNIVTMKNLSTKE